jgi:ribonuclease HI
VIEWWNIHHPNKLKSPSVKEHWLYPDVGWLKVNVDGAFRDAGKVGGGGVVICDHHGKFISGACHFFPQVRDAECAELLACKRALQVALECQAAKIVLETDSTQVEAKLKVEGIDRSVHGPLVAEIKLVLHHFEDSRVRSVRRLANDAAHQLAKLGCENKLCKVWGSYPPDCIKKHLVSESVTH